MFDKSEACCFAGYRPEKFKLPQTRAAAMLAPELETAVRHAIQDGYRLFVTGMSRGFDLWAAQTVLRLRKEFPVKLLCAIPFDRQSQGWENDWQTLYQKILFEADFVHSLSHEYTPDCFFIRNRFMIEGCTRLICWYDGCPGGTRFTVQCARRRGLELVNLADQQLCLFHTG